MPTSHQEEYMVSPDLQVEPLDSRSSIETHQIIVNGRRFKVNRNFLEIVDYFRTPRTLGEFIDWFKHSWRLTPQRAAASPVTPDNLIKVGIIVRNGDKGTTTIPPKRVLLLQTELWKSTTLDPVTDRLKYLFRQAVWPYVTMISLGIYLTLLIVETSMQQPIIGQHHNWWALVIPLYASLVFHELGHLSACKLFGVRHGSMGCGFFFIYPVLYADVTNCWSLNRYRRAVVDIAGVYFQMIFGAGIAAIGIATGSLLMQVSSVTILVSIAVNLNPFFRLDGYWLMSDISGVTSMEKLRNRLISYYWHRLTGRNPPRRLSEINRQPSWVLGLVVAYTTICGIFVVHLINVIYRGLPRAMDLVVANQSTLVTLMESPSITNVLNLLVALGVALITVACLSRLLFRLAKRSVPLLGDLASPMKEMLTRVPKSPSGVRT